MGLLSPPHTQLPSLRAGGRPTECSPANTRAGDTDSEGVWAAGAHGFTWGFVVCAMLPIPLLLGTEPVFPVSVPLSVSSPVSLSLFRLCPSQSLSLCLCLCVCLFSMMYH